MVQKQIVILGGSYGGVSIAHNLLKHAIPKLPDSASYQVVLVSTSSEAMCRPACPRALISVEMFPQDKLFTSITEAFKHYPANSFRFVHGTATELDHNKRTVHVSRVDEENEILTYYALVIATGASTPSPLLGLNRDEKYLRHSWDEFRDALSTATSIVVAGGGPAGVETAGELGEYFNGRPGWFGSRPSKLKLSITIINSGPKILSVLRPSITKQAENYLAQVGVTVLNNSRVKSVSPEGAGTSDITAHATVTLEDGKTLDADLYIPATGQLPNTKFIAQSLLTTNGRVDTNASTLRVDKAGERIYAVGDVASYSRPAIHLMIEAIPVLASNIKRDLMLAAGMDSKIIPKERVYKEDTRETQMVPIGKSKGVGAAMGWQLPSFMVWLIKGRDYWLWTTGPLWSGKQWEKES